MYALPVEQVESMIEDANSEFRSCRWLLQHYLGEENEDHVCVLLAELYWANYNIAKTLQEGMEDPELTEEGHVVFAEKPLLLIQTLAHSKKAASYELNRLSVSTTSN